MILMGIGIVCLAVAVFAFSIGSTLAYFLCGVSVLVALLMFFNSYRVFKEKKENKVIALKAEKQLVSFIAEHGFKADGDAVIDFNKPFMLFDSKSKRLLCGMPLSECVLIPYSKLLGARLYGRKEVKAETEDFAEYLAEIAPEYDESENRFYVPENKGLLFVFLINDTEEPLYELEFVNPEYVTNSYYYREVLKIAEKYVAQLDEIIAQEADEEDDAEIVFWEFEE